MPAPQDPDLGDQLTGGMAGVGVFRWEAQKWHPDFYSGLVELFNDGWFYAVKLELVCPSDRARNRPNFKNNGQKVADANSVTIEAIHVRIVNRAQLQLSLIHI